MQKLTAALLTLLLLGALAACQPTATPTPPPPTETSTSTPLPPEPSATPTQTPIPALNAQNSPPLQAFSMFAPADGWGLVTNQLLLTHDSGTTWFSVPLPGGQVDQNTSALFVSAQNLYLLLPGADGSSGTLYASNNGGGLWTQSAVPFAHGQLTFIDGSLYFLATAQTGTDSMSAALYLSSDNGQTWSQVAAQNGASLPEAGLKSGLSFISKQNGWVGFTGQTGKVTLYRTQDGGQSWTPQDLQTPQNIASLTTNTLPPVFFSGDEKNGLLAVDYIAQDTGAKNRVFYTTNDGGQNWFPGAGVVDGGPYTFVDAKNGWMWGKHGLYTTNNAGQAWQLLPVAFGRSEQATILTFIDTRSGWIVTADAKNRVRLYNTKDGGNTWVAINP